MNNLIDTKSSPSWKWRQCQTEWVQPNINQNVCDNLRRALQFRSKGIAERRESVTLIEWINLRGKRLDRSPFTFFSRVRRHLRNYSCFCPVSQRGKAKVDLPLDGFFNKSLLRSKIKQNNSIRTIKRPQLHARCTWTNFLLHPTKKKKKSLVKYHSPRMVTSKWASRQEVVITYSWVVKLSSKSHPFIAFLWVWATPADMNTLLCSVAHIMHATGAGYFIMTRVPWTFTPLRINQPHPAC